MVADKLIVPRWVFDTWRFKTTTPGKIVMGGIFVSGLGTVSVLIPIYQIFIALMSVYLISWTVGWIFRPTLQVSGGLPAKATVGQPIIGEFLLTNTGKRTAFDVMLFIVDLPQQVRMTTEDLVIPTLPKGESTAIPCGLIASRRGLYVLPDLRPHSTFPFHLIRNGRTRHELGSLLVYPHFHPLTEIDLPVGTRYQPGGIALTSHIGESPEYIGNREYVPGQSVKRLDFRAWARTGKPVVREYQEEYYCRIALILDTFLPPAKAWGPFFRDPVSGQIVFATIGADGLFRVGADAVLQSHPRFEEAVSMTAAIADALSNGEYIIDLFAAGSELHVFRSGRHTAHFENVLEILSCVETCRENPFLKIGPAVAEELGTISTAVCVFLEWDQTRQQLCRTILEAGCSLKVIVIRDDHQTEPLDAGEVTDFTEFTVSQIRQGLVEVL